MPAETPDVEATAPRNRAERRAEAGGERPQNPEGWNPLADFANKAQVADLFGVTERTIDRWTRLRVIPQPRKIGRQRLWHLPTLRKSLARETAAA